MIKLSKTADLYPHIYKKLLNLIGNQDAVNTYLEQFVLDERDTQRQGFHPEAFHELSLLYKGDHSYKGDTEFNFGEH